MTKQELQLGYSYLIYDNSIGDEPIEAYNMRIMDGEIFTGEWESINSLSAQMGNSFVPVPYLKEGYMLIHMSFGFGSEYGNTDSQEWIWAMDSINGNNSDMRESLRDPADVDYVNLPLGMYGFFSAFEVKSVPKMI